MYVKLILRNVRRSVRDYLIYIVTLTLCAAMFYAFLSIASGYYRPDIGAEFDITMLGKAMKFAVTALTCLMVFLVSYVNKYMIRRRQKEFALQMIMGMEQRTIARLFFAETLCMGAVALALGIVLGALLSQFITAMLLSAYHQAFRVSWMLFPDTIAQTAVFFLLCFCVVGLWNVKALRRLPIVTMLSADRQNEAPLSKGKWMPAVTVLYLLMHGMLVNTGVSRLLPYYDARLPLPARMMMWGAVAAPLFSLAVALIYSIAVLVRDGKYGQRQFGRLLMLLLVTMLPMVFYIALVPRYKMKYLLAIGADTTNLYLMYMLGCVGFFICAVIYLASDVIAEWKERAPEHRYKGENLFFYGQILSRLRTAVKTMTLISLTLAFSIGIFMVEPILTGWIKGYLAVRAVFDVQIASSYNSIYDEEELSALVGDGYSLVSDYLREQGVVLREDCALTVYLPRREDFHNRKKYEFPVTAIALSDYNTLRSMRGLEAVTLGEGEFLTQWQAIASQEDMDSFMETHPQVETDAGTLVPVKDSVCKVGIGEMLYNSYVDVIYVFPDAVCEELMAVGSCRFINTQEAIPYGTAAELQRRFEEAYEGQHCFIRAKSEQINSATTSFFVLKVSMLYGAIILMLSCITILALQQLSEADQFGYRFGILGKMGVEESRMNRLIVKQIAFWFGLPIGTAVLAAGVFVRYLSWSLSEQIAAYIGNAALLGQLAGVSAVLLALLGCYFVTTWVLFKRALG
ncbi:MAG: ABC transporter permease [Roseburia sp.]|nr:ABC transporter permease [Roseburia sp.]